MTYSITLPNGTIARRKSAKGFAYAVVVSKSAERVAAELIASAERDEATGNAQLADYARAAREKAAGAVAEVKVWGWSARLELAERDAEKARAAGWAADVRPVTREG